MNHVYSMTLREKKRESNNLINRANITEFVMCLVMQNNIETIKTIEGS